MLYWVKQVARSTTQIEKQIKKLQTTDNPLYTDTRFNDKIRYNDNLTVTKPSLKR